MSCDCEDKLKSDGVFRSGLQYRFVSPGTTTFLASDGKAYRIDELLIPRPYQPRGGWSAEIYIHNQKTTLGGSHPSTVFHAVQSLLDLNEITYTVPALWLNLQIQWLSRAIQKYQKVRLEDVLAIASPNY